MPSTAHRRLDGPSRIELYPEWAFLFLGPAFGAAGAAVAFVDRLSSAETLRAMPPAVFRAAQVFGLAIVLSGVYIFQRGLIWLARERLRRRERPIHPGEPWRWDYPWNPRGALDERLDRAIQAGAAAALTAVIALPFVGLSETAFGIVRGGLKEGFRLSFGALSLPVVPLLLALGACWAVARFAAPVVRFVLGAGRLRPTALRFASFPFFLGERLEARFADLDSLRGFTTLAVTLRCVEEAVVRERAARNRSVLLVRRNQVYLDRLLLRPSDAPTDASGLALSFALPSSALPTRLSERPARYWELRLLAQRGAERRFDGTYLVPVYARPDPAVRSPSGIDKPGKRG